MLWLKAFHIIFVVCWFAGLFYLVRLFVYHAEAEQEEEPKRSILKEQYEIMESRLYYIITWPGMVITAAMGGALLYFSPWLMKDGWMHVKLTFIVVLIGYHFYCGRVMNQLKAGTNKLTGRHFRMLNEAPTLLLVAIVFLAVLKNSTNFLYGVGGLIAFGMLLMLGIRVYRKIREGS